MGWAMDWGMDWKNLAKVDWTKSLKGPKGLIW